MFGNVAVSALKCGFGGAHGVTSARLELSIPRVRELLDAWAQLADAEARFRLGWGEDGPYVEETGTDPMVIADEGAEFLARDPQTGAVVASVGFGRSEDDGFMEVGGLVHPAFRRFGFGREALELVCAFAHQHFGIVELRAKCETDNEASRRWLAAAGFLPVEGVVTHTLPDGRTAAVLRWRHLDPTAQRRCKQRFMPVG
ncbi:GNAT family N-acetyltransferase [Dactylosporangium sp. NBC_01737]|uniref:GNAT family N-acetyltransferase n=1 Tax=Dactylosporangium sp. NBC_01737 TaxID=2975959 RepID=UPI002E154C5C|nr:GNAT family N-acetyltransferase [Dactylosporangium sp. NBC_01737]